MVSYLAAESLGRRNLVFSAAIRKVKQLHFDPLK